MTDPRVKSLCDEFDVEIVDRHRYPKPGQTRATTTIRRIIDRRGVEHTRIALCILAEGRGNHALIDEVSLWAVSDLVIACADLVEADTTAFLEMFDRMPLGPLMAVVNELNGIVPQRPALAGLLYIQLRRLREESLTGRQAVRKKVSVVNDSEEEKGRAPFKRAGPGGSWMTKAEKISLGRDLLEKKDALPWGEFGRWLRSDVQRGNGAEVHETGARGRSRSGVAPRGGREASDLAARQGSASLGNPMSEIVRKSSRTQRAGRFELAPVGDRDLHLDDRPAAALME